MWSVLLLVAVTVSDSVPDDPAPADFARDVLPLLADRCFACHGPDEAAREADLRLDVREGALAPSESGRAAVVPGDPAGSALVARIAHTNPRRRMPPEDSGKALDERERALLTRWIAEGAPYGVHWAYEVPRAAPLPPLSNAAWCREPLDHFVLARLEREGLTPSPEADPTTLLRRATLVLIGLPPKPTDVDTFCAEVAAERAAGPVARPDAYDRAVARLLASPHYGERMALEWLDAVRYADSNGFQQDGDTHQWVWRDWLVGALNDDVPLDRLATLVLAGDLLPAATSQERLEQQVASGMQRLHLLNGEGGAIPEEQRHNVVFDRVDVFATAFLGLTASCAQCHDHKFDPLTQRDYYALFDFFNRVPESGVPPGGGQYRIADPWVSCGTRDENARLAALEDELAERARAVGAEPDRTDTPDPARAERDALRARLPRVMVMSDTRPRETHVLARGNYEAPLEQVTAAAPAFLPQLVCDGPPDRLALARWLAAPEQPLFARVAVDRAWRQVFGAGLVTTPEDFGVQGAQPSHPELLDTMAVALREGGWRLKELHRELVTSATFRQASATTGAAGTARRARDPDNRLLARYPRHRLPAMLLRDVALAASGLLVPDVGGPPVYPYQPAGIWSGLTITKERDFTYPTSHGPGLYRRSLYTFWRRTVAPGNMFDVSTRQSCVVRPRRTSSPLHALVTSNDPTWVEAARALAERALRHAGGSDDLALCDAFRRVLARHPSTEELALLSRTLRRGIAAYTADPGAAAALLAVGESLRDTSLDPIRHAALTLVCSNLLNLDEALTCE